jgi:type II secretory pathway pseudopilin PulG
MTTSSNNQPGFSVSHLIAAFIVAFVIVLAVLELVASMRRAARARQESNAAREIKCKVIMEAIEAGYAAGWKPRADQDSKPWRRKTGVCLQWELEDCTERVPLLLILDSTNPSLSERFNKTGEDCSREKRFALRFGIEAFAEHRRLLDDAVEDAGSDQMDGNGLERD